MASSASRTGTDDGAPLEEPRGEEGVPGQALRLVVTGMGGFWRVDVFGIEEFKTWDCKTPSELGSALAEAYSILRGIAP